MKLGTRVLSLVLAGSMALSVTPVSAFAATPVLGGGTVSPTALSETNSTGTLAFDKYGYPYDSTSGDEYNIDHSTTPVISSDESWVYKEYKNGNESAYFLLLGPTFDQDLTGQTINCPVTSSAPTLTGGTYNGTVQLGTTLGKSDASGCTFNAPIVVLAADTTLTNCTANSSVQCAAANITLTGCTINRTSDDSTVLWLSKYDNSNSAAGCSMTLNNCTVSCGVLVGADGEATINGGTYNIPGTKMGIVADGAIHIIDGAFTTQIVADTNGSVTIDYGTFNLGEKKYISAAGGDIVINGGTFSSYLQALNGSITIKNGTFTGLIGTTNGNITIEDGTFTGQTVAFSASDAKYTGVLSITGGLFAKEPNGAAGGIYKLSADGASFNGMESPVYIANQTAVPHITMTYPANAEHQVIAWCFDIDNNVKQHGNSDATATGAQDLLAQANYQHSADNRTVSFDCVPSVTYNGFNIAALTADTVFTPVLDVLPSELTFHAATENTQASVELGSGMPTDTIDVACFYTNVDTNEVFEEYPTKAGTYQISARLTVKGLSDELKDNKFENRIEWSGVYHQITSDLLTNEDWTFTILPPAVPSTDADGNVQIPEGETEVKGDGWTAKKDTDEAGKDIVTVDITDGSNLEGTTLNCDEITIGSEEAATTVSNITTNANVTVASGSIIESGIFSGSVSGEGTISGGTFTGDVDVTNITGGVFAGNIPATVESTKVTATGGASINNIKNDGNSEDNETTVQVVGEPTLALAYTPDAGRTFYGWQKDKTEMIVKGEESTNTKVKVDSTDSDPVYTPVVKLIKADLDDFELTEVAETEGYYQVVDGELTGDCLGSELPTAPGTYALGVKLTKKTAEPTENSIALYADDSASVGGSVLMKEGVGYYVPEVLAIGDAETVIDPDAGSSDSGAGGAAVAVIGGAAIGGAAYLIGTQVYLTNVLPEGASIPTNRQQLADLLWTAAGKPQPASTALFTDISADAADSQKAARWCVEQGLLKDTGSTFKPGEYTFRPQVIKAWNDLQAKLNNQK